MLYVSEGDISRASVLNTPDHGDFVLPIHHGSKNKGTNATRIVANPLGGGRIYWTDAGAKTISRAFINGSDRQTVVEFR